jgi:carboxyl-terminal processing protease
MTGRISSYSSHFFSMAVLVMLFAFASCKEDDPAPAEDQTPNGKINSWIEENMAFWYLWNDQLPQNPDKSLSPDAFFESLLVDQDRFSWIQDDYQELINSLQGVTKESGYEFVLYRESAENNNVIAQIVYIKPDSPAEDAGLKRGDVITHVNATQLTIDNYSNLIDAMHEDHSIQFRAIDIENEAFAESQTIQLNALQYSEDPNYLSKVIDADGKKIGYYVYNFFAEGTTASPSAYRTKMDQIFAEFKSQGITDLIVDLRYNGGGSETSASNLASLIGFGIDNTKVFSRREYNSGVEEAIKNDPDLGPSFLITKFQTKTQNVGSMLSGNRVYILTSSRTASASELVVNALKPFMDVFLIGDVTYGKNVGSISLEDEDNPENNWGMQPIVVKVYNSLDESNYSDGFAPNVINEDNDLILYPLGDVRESMLSTALGEITGSSSLGRKGNKTQRAKTLGFSIDQNKRSFNLVIDQNVPNIKSLIH